MKVKPLITIYITNYNYEKYIEASIKSAINQTYKNLEIIVIDDCSSDSSVNIIKKFKKKYMMKTIFNKNRKGLIKSANIAMRASKGKYLNWPNTLPNSNFKVHLKESFYRYFLFKNSL